MAVFVATRIFILFGFKDERRDPHMLDDAHEQPGRNPRKECGEQNSPDHDLACLVAGKADGVARVMRRIVQPVGMGETNAENQYAAHDDCRNAGGQTL